MSKKISARQVHEDLKSGMSDHAVMEKYGINAAGLAKVRARIEQIGLSRNTEGSHGEERQPHRTIDHAPCPSCGFPLNGKSLDCPKCGVLLSRVTATPVPRDGFGEQEGVSNSTGHLRTEKRPQAESGVRDYDEEGDFGAAHAQIRSRGKLAQFFGDHKLIAIMVCVVGVLLVLALIGFGVETYFKSKRMNAYKQVLDDCRNNLSMSSKPDFEASLERVKRLIAAAAGTAKGTSWSEEEVAFMVFSALDETDRFLDEMKRLADENEELYGRNAAQTGQLLKSGVARMVASIGNKNAKASIRLSLISRGYVSQ
ncbi:MAG: hypothetical protein HY913_17015 [Desulfomonile tiedjei]|nr:hypothetical protein [Desulfomonile tiedjei]